MCIRDRIEVVAVAHLALNSVAQLRRLRRAVLEVHVVDERERHHEHERAEVPERSPVAPPMHVPAESAEQEEERRQHLLNPGIVAKGISQPLPPEIQSPHLDLRDERRLPLGQTRLPILAAAVSYT